MDIQVAHMAHMGTAFLTRSWTHDVRHGRMTYDYMYFVILLAKCIGKPGTQTHSANTLNFWGLHI